MTKDAVAKTWVVGTDLTLHEGVLYSDPANVPGGGDPGDPLFFDDFNYTLDRVDSDANKTAILVSAGWTGIKDTNQSAGARGYIYTVDSIEGDSSGIPGGGRALCIEANPISSGGSQADLYIQYGAEPGVLGTLPADCWIQFWMYLQRDAGSSKVSDTPSGKFLYALHGARTSYPENPLDTAWLFGCSATAYDPVSGLPTVTAPETGAFTFNVEANPCVADFNNASESERRLQILAQENAGHVFYRASPMEDPEFTHFRPNRWYLVRTHHDVSATGGKWEMWAREKGTLTFTKMADFRDGVTQGGTTIYNTFQGVAHDEGTTHDHDGPRILRMPTTAGSDYWLYMKDFAIADAEADLPTYGSY